MALGVNLAKTNLAVASHPDGALRLSKGNVAVASHPPARIVVGKTNLMVASRPAGAWAAISKTNISIASGGGVPGGKRRKLFVS